MSLRYYFKMRSYIDSPVFQHIVSSSNLRLFANKRKTIPFSLRICNLLNEMNINGQYVKPAFKLNVGNRDDPLWASSKVNNDISLSDHSKRSTSTQLKFVFIHVCKGNSVVLLQG